MSDAQAMLDFFLQLSILVCIARLIYLVVPAAVRWICGPDDEE